MPLNRAAGIATVFSFGSVAKLGAGFDEAFRSEGPTTVVIDLEPQRAIRPQNGYFTERERY
jgi:hypothetical protein